MAGGRQGSAWPAPATACRGPERDFRAAAAAERARPSGPPSWTNWCAGKKDSSAGVKEVLARAADPADSAFRGVHRSGGRPVSRQRRGRTAGRDCPGPGGPTRRGQSRRRTAQVSRVAVEPARAAAWAFCGWAAKMASETFLRKRAGAQKRFLTPFARDSRACWAGPTASWKPRPGSSRWPSDCWGEPGSSKARPRRRAGQCRRRRTQLRDPLRRVARTRRHAGRRAAQRFLRPDFAAEPVAGPAHAA